jgi:hypothetical protein
VSDSTDDEHGTEHGAPASAPADAPASDLDEVRRIALGVVMTWGPEMARPAEERLLERRPGLDDTTVHQALAEARLVTSKAEKLAPAEKGVGDAPLTRADIRRDHPWVNDELLERAIQQGLYSHWRDTGL